MLADKDKSDLKPPSLRDLGADLLRVSILRRIAIVATPFLFVAFYLVFALVDLWPLAVLALIGLSFSTYGSTSHELVHRNLHLPYWLNELLLCLTELTALRSGHAYRVSHLHHHARFPHEDDIEACGTRRSLLGVILLGFTLQFRIWLWAVCRTRMSRYWIAAEGMLVLGVVVLSVVLAASAPWLTIYVILMLFGHAMLPLATVWLVHIAEGSNVLFQTRAFRGRMALLLGLGHLFHLEHHLYPRVPHPNWPELARRIEPFLTKAGVPFYRITLVTRPSPASDRPPMRSSQRTCAAPASPSTKHRHPPV